jgi:hypothetical protein
MDAATLALSMVAGEAQSLLARLDRILPFALHMTMVGAARGSAEAQNAIQAHLDRQIASLRGLLAEFIGRLEQEGDPAAVQRRLAFLKLRYNQVLSHFDIFSDVLVQRSEHEHGVHIAGLDAVAADGLQIPHHRGRVPPVLCYLDRGHGAAIRRARTRLPGGGENPVALIRVPRERMVGSGVGSSLLHEVGHQAAALLHVVAPLRMELRLRAGNHDDSPYAYFARWISEIVADFWSVLKLGITSTIGLIGVVTLPTPFVFRIGLEDPHPFPWMRVQISAALGQALFPDPQWAAVARAWEQLYPLHPLPDGQRRLIESQLEALPGFVSLLLAFEPPVGEGIPLSELVEAARQPRRLRAIAGATLSLKALESIAPTLALAAIGQARHEGHISAAQEQALLRSLLTTWALRRSGQPALRAPADEAEPVLTGANL